MEILCKLSWNHEYGNMESETLFIVNLFVDTSLVLEIAYLDDDFYRNI